VCLPFSALENYLFGRTGRIDRDRARQELVEGAERLGFRVDPDRPARGLSVGERQQLEIVRLLSLGVRVLILDEPTSGISTGQRTALFEALRTLASEGLIVLFVSHKLEEVEELCSRVTVMQKGKVVGERSLPCPTDELVSMMFGKSVELGRASGRPGDEVTVSVAGLSSAVGRRRVEDVDLDVRAGEILGLAGLAGSGQRALLRALAGLDHPGHGTIILDGHDITAVPHRRRRRLGVHYLPAGRLEEGLFPGLTLTEHIALAAPSGSVVDWSAAETETDAAIAEYQVVGTPAMPIEDLSGGNQQRMLLAMMPEHVRLLLLEEPTRGLDIESANRIWERLLARAAGGTAILVASADLDELIRYCHRIAVFFDGRIIDVVDGATADPLVIGSLIGGRRSA
jgi:simple sugar transport system ATP-binding protein